MRLSFGQELRLVQRQVLAPKMIQSMEILQLPIAALEERIEKEISENPMLERAEEDPDSPQEPEPPPAPEIRSPDEQEMVVGDTAKAGEELERLLDLSDDWPEQFDGRPRLSSQRLEEEADRKSDAMANLVARRESLQDHLREQLGWLDLDPLTHRLAERIIDNLDPNGYFHGTLEEIVDPGTGQEQLAAADQALATVQHMDPAGVGARDLRECLLLQLQPGTAHYEPLRTLISEHLVDLQYNRLPLIQRRSGYSIEVIQEALVELRKLNPKPGAMFDDSEVPTLTPDVYVEPDENGQFRVRLEEGRTPSLRISRFYRDLLRSGKATGDEKEYIKRKLNAAQWLIESIEQRRNTLARVTQAIIDHQTAFLTKGPEFIEPLKMQQIADKVGVHVTTVSRAVDDKCVQTPQGIFPLKRFFGGGTVTDHGDQIAWDAVRLKLHEIIDGEDKQNPFSDDELVVELEKHGLNIARRTVTKYRKMMDIPSSRQRRDWSLVAASKAQQGLEEVHAEPQHADDEEHEPVGSHSA
jgi:RNA polymerase sigma-54 factor